MKIILPRKELRPYVRYYWMLESHEPFSVLTFPIGCPQIIFHRGTPLHIPELGVSQSRFTVSGQVNFPAHISSEGDTEMIVAVFYPNTIGIFIDTPPSEFYNLEISGYDLENKALNQLSDEIFCCDNPQSGIGIIEHYLLYRLNDAEMKNYRRIGAALTKLIREPSKSVAELADIACLSRKQFGRVFNEAVGMMPKEYARIVRFQKSLWIMQNGESNDTALAVEAGYSDQSHFIRDFKVFSGHTPQKLRQICIPYSDLFAIPM